jgi:hypothetical protein
MPHQSGTSRGFVPFPFGSWILLIQDPFYQCDLRHLRSTKTQNPASKTQFPGVRSQNPAHETQKPGDQTQFPGQKTQFSDDKLLKNIQILARFLLPL